MIYVVKIVKMNSKKLFLIRSFRKYRARLAEARTMKGFIKQILKVQSVQGPAAPFQREAPLPEQAADLRGSQTQDFEKD